MTNAEWSGGDDRLATKGGDLNVGQRATGRPAPAAVLGHMLPMTELPDLEEDYRVPVMGMATVQGQGYSRFLNDVYIGVILTLMVVSCLCCMCSCLVYHKIKQWKIEDLARRNNVRPTNETNRGCIETESLPSYTIVTGLPSYEEAIEVIRKASTAKQPRHELIHTIFSPDKT